METDGENLQHVGKVLRAFAGAIFRENRWWRRGRNSRINTLQCHAFIQLVETPGRDSLDEEPFLEELNKKRAASRKKEHVNEVTFNTKGSYGSGKAEERR